MTTQILTNEDIQQKIKRIAYEILENNYDEKELQIIGIRDKGFQFAQKIYDCLKTITPIKLSLHFIALDKLKPIVGEAEFDFDAKELSNKVVILVDDVGNTGKTLCYALQPLLESRPKKIEIAVLVDRQHKLFPVSADYVGLSLATTMKETVTVDFNNGRGDAAFLS